MSTGTTGGAADLRSVYSVRTKSSLMQPKPPGPVLLTKEDGRKDENTLKDECKQESGDQPRSRFTPLFILPPSSADPCDHMTADERVKEP